MSRLCRDGLRVVVARKSHAKVTGTLKIRGLGTTPMNLIQETMRATPATARIGNASRLKYSSAASVEPGRGPPSRATATGQ